MKEQDEYEGATLNVTVSYSTKVNNNRLHYDTLLIVSAT